MTALNATILPAYAVMTQDTSATGVEGSDTVRNLAERFAGTETTYLSDSESTSCKMSAFPDQRMVVGGAGSLLLSLIWRCELKRDPCDIDTLDQRVRKRLPELRDELLSQFEQERPGLDESFILHIGYSQERGHIIGRLYRADDGFAGQVIEPANGHLIQPAEMNPSDPEYRELYEAWTPAAQGKGVDRFHELMTAHQYRGAQAGMYRGTPAGINDTVDMGRVTPFTASITHG